MHIYFANIALIYLWAVLLLVVKPNNNKKMAYCAIVCLQWVLISGLRHYTIGADTDVYMYSFNRTKSTSWLALLLRFWNYFKGDRTTKDPGYYIICKIFQIFSDDYQVFLVFIALVFTVAMAIWIYKNSEMPCLSFIIYSTLFFSFYALTGHRQTLATALVVFVGYKFLKEKKPIQFFIICFFAFFIHKSIAIYATFYFFANKKITWKYLGIFGALSASFILFGRQLYGIFIELLSFDEYDVYVNTPRSYIIFIVIVSAISFVCYKDIKERRPDDYFILYNALLFALTFTLLTFREQTFMRVQQYYSLYLMLILPDVIKTLEKKVKVLPYLLLSAVLIYRLYSSHQQYLFFWQ